MKTETEIKFKVIQISNSIKNYEFSENTISELKEMKQTLEWVLE